MTITEIVLTSEGRGNQMRMQIEATTLDDNRDLLHERLAKLLGRVVVIKVGATTEADLQEKKARLDMTHLFSGTEKLHIHTSANLSGAYMKTRIAQLPPETQFGWKQSYALTFSLVLWSSMCYSPKCI